MTDRELIIACADKVMKWEVQGDARCCNIAEPLGGGAYRWRGCMWPANDPHIEKIEGWNPLESDADAFMLVDRLTAEGRYFDLTKRGGWQARVSPEGSMFGVWPEAGDPDRRRAIVLAALKAKGIIA